MQGGDFMLATNILLSGNNYTKVALLFQFMNIGIVAPGTFYAIQNAYCVDAVKEFWEEKRNVVIDRLRHKDNVVALADGRMDSPGQSQKPVASLYSYIQLWSTMEQETMDIISVLTVDKRQTDRKSVDMEKVAFIKTFDSLMSELDIKEIVTDAHVQIAALMHPERGRYKDRGVIHSLDVWHAAKNLTKKLHASIWRGVLHHVCGEHEWALGRCLHEPLDHDTLRKEVILPGSPAHEALSQIVLNKRWLKDLEKFLSFRYKRVYRKKSQRYSVHTVRTKKDYNYIPQLQAKLDRGTPKEEESKARGPTEPRSSPRNCAPTYRRVGSVTNLQRTGHVLSNLKEMIQKDKWLN
ncbi:unnamed protein product [Leuciscus chuanchicus]